MFRRSLVVAVLASAMLAGIGVLPASATHQTVTAVNGNATGYHAYNISFGNPTGPTPTATVAVDASNSPQSATAATGRVAYGPAVLFTSNAISVAVSGSVGLAGSVTSSTSINDVNTSHSEILGEDNYDCCGLDGSLKTTATPRPLTSIASTCTASKAGVSGSTTLTNGWLYLDSGWYDGDLIYPEPAALAGGLAEHDPVKVLVPQNPAVGTAYTGHLHLSAGATDNYVLVFNEQVTNPDGSLTVNAVHEYFATTLDGNGNRVADPGSFLKGDLVLGQSVCGVTLGAGPNADPVAGDDAYNTGDNAQLIVPAPGVLGNDTDADGGNLTAGSPSDPPGGSVTLNANGSFTYTPDTGFSGTDSFTYAVTDDHGATDTATVTITPDTYLAVSNEWVTEGNSGTTTANFTVNRSGNTARTSSVRYRTINGTATAGSDFTGIPSNVTLNFAVGETTKTVAVTVSGDTVAEPNETFSVALSAPVGATISDTTGAGTIVNDGDPRTYLSINDAVVTEGNAGTVMADFTITRSGITSGATTISYKTTNGTALSGSDYTAAVLTPVTFAAGETTKAVSVSVTGDTADEANETFTVNLSVPSAGTVIADVVGMGTIVDDDGAITPGPATFYSVSDVSVAEGDTGTRAATFTVTRSGNTASAGSVKYATANASATAPGDFTAQPLTVVNFAAGETMKPVSVDVVGDTIPEGDETFRLNLSAPTGGVISDTLGTATIVNNEFSYLSINDRSVSEGNAGSSVATFTLTRSGNTSAAASVSYTTVNGTATAGSDYTAVVATPVIFAAGETTKVISVIIAGDIVVEPNETFGVSLTAPSGLVITDLTGVGTIRNDD